MSKTLTDFVKYYHLNQYRSPEMLEWIESIYNKFHPVKIHDQDLKQFLTVIYLAVRFFKPKNVIQTGTFTGLSSMAIAKGFKENKHGLLYTIDPEPPAYFGIDNPVNIAREAVSSAQLQSEVILVKGYSTVPNDESRMDLVPGKSWCLTEIAEKVAYDMMVIDGDHTFLGCFNDLYYGAAGLSIKGPRLMIVHDYLGIPAVKEAVRKWKSSHNSVEIKIVPSPCGIALIRLN